MKENGPSIFFYINSWFTSILFVFFVAGFITFFSESFTSPTVKSWLKGIQSEHLFVHFIEAENHHFYQDSFSTDASKISNTLLKLATNIQPADIRTFLGSELPGFSIFDTEIVVAGDGTDFTTIPVESAPPMEVLLKEREIAKEKLDEVEKNADDTPSIIEKKSVYIYHSHSWESFAPLLKGIKTSDEAVSSNEKVNVIAVGRKLSEELNRKGIGAEHNTTNMTQELKKKNWNYNNSYTLSRELVEEAIAQNKDLTYFIDIHRDSLPRDKTTTIINQKEYARMFFIVGKENKNYEENLKVATELHEKLNATFPNISRGVFKKGISEGNGVYNQDLSNRAILLEFGGVENDLTEIYNSIEAFSEVFSEYYWEAEMVDGDGS